MFIRALFCCLVFSLSTELFAKQIKILASIKPLQLLATDILGDAGQVDVLLSAKMSPHNYALKPSDREKLLTADLLLWVGPDMEAFLAKSLSAKTNQLAMTELSSWQKNQDLHLWLEPNLVLNYAETLAVKLGKTYPDKAEYFLQNSERFKQKFRQLDKRLIKQFKPLSEQKFLVFHNGWSRFVTHYDLHQKGFVLSNPSRPAGTRHLYKIRQLFKQENISCVFTEPQFKRKLLKRLSAGSSVRLGQLDPLAGDIELGSDNYVRFWQATASSVQQCLALDA